MDRLCKAFGDRPCPRPEVWELPLIFDISRTLGASLDMKRTVAPVLKILADYLKMPRGALTILNRRTGEIVIEDSYGLSPEQRARGRYRLGEGVTGKVVQTGKPAVVPDISSDPSFLDRTGARKGSNKKGVSFICVPIMIGGEAIGALSVDLPYEKDGFFEERVRILTVVASLIAQAVQLRQAAQEEMQKLQEENVRLHDELKTRFHPSNIIGNSSAMQGVFDLIEKVSASDATVLILGESGVGKELVANSIHYNSPRAKGPFITFNAAALPADIIESELFGHEKGAFTGASSSRKGRFELAHGGTIFIDEIGDMPPQLQVKLLRVLQERSFERVGGGETVKVDVRILTATNQDLDLLIKQGKFRTDLYYRLNVFPISVPPLRQRRTDILLLADHFAEKFAKKMKKSIRRISTPVIDMLMSYHWPGNVRELENVVERAVILSNDGVIHGFHLPPTLQTAEASGTSPRGKMSATLAAVEREMIAEALKASKGNAAEAARTLGVTERTMGLRLKEHKISPSRFKE